MIVRVVGKKARMIVQSRGGGEHEPGIHEGDKVVAHEMFDFVNTWTVRTGEEPAIQAPSGARCGGISHPHNVKKASPMYDMGPKEKGMGNSLMCRDHYQELHTLELLIADYKKSYYGPVQIIDPRTGEVFFTKE